MENYSLSDIASVTGDNFGGGNSWIVLIILFAMIFGWGGNGFGGNRTDDSAVLAGQRADAISRQINQVGDGLSSLGYSQLQQMDANTASINGNITSEGRALQAQLSNCCCENQRNTDALRYDMTVQNNAITTAIHAEGEATRNLIQQNKIETLQQKVNQLELASSLGNVVRYPVATTYNAGYNPFCGSSCN